MGTAFYESDAGNRIVLEGAVDIGSAAELKAILLQALNAGGAVRVLLDRVEFMDVTSVQLLWAAEQQARRAGLEFQICGPLPEPVSAVLADAGFPSMPASINAE